MPSTKRTINIYTLMEECLQRHLPFAGYRLPGSKRVNLILQADASGMTRLGAREKIIGQKGFVFFPYPGSSQPRVLLKADFHITDKTITEDVLIRILTKTNFSENGFQRAVPHEASKEEFIREAEKFITKIKKGTIKKGVLSRVRLHNVNENIQVIRHFKKLVKSYPDAFAYVISLPNIGLWLGASPELLLQHEDEELQTVSLAGTRKQEKKESFSWGKKEIDEQKIVTDYIANIFEKHFKEKPEAAGPETFAAGPVEHLKTTLRLKIDSAKLRKAFDPLLKDLHPTPAVAGMPKDAAMKLIDETEKHDRAYYTGFLGPVNIDNATHLFVNLRCLEILENKLALYTGAGITKDSDPDAEWEETQLKTQTLLNVL